MSELERIDQESEAVRVGFRITLDDLRARVTDTEYITRDHLTIAVIKLDNGFYLVGKAAPVDPDNYNAEYGRKLANDDALRQAWPLLAFAHLES
jgi:Phage protein (N4 Gp49/phage Sf6 gene 66) family